MADEAFEPFVPRRASRTRAEIPTEKPPEEVPEAARPIPEEVRSAAPLPTPDPAACSTAVRELAIRLAARACARALGEAIARNPLFVARFVDDALRASGGPCGARARLAPDDARRCAGRVGCEVVADETLTPGEVLLDFESGSIGATVEMRAEGLVAAAADE